MLLKNASVLLGEELRFVSSINLRISDEKFKKIKPNLRPSSKEDVFDCEGLIIIPGLVNCHTHIGDSVAKDILLHENADDIIHPVVGIKSKILKKTNPSTLVYHMKNTCKAMIRKGITTFVDFREGGLEGIVLLKKALSSMPIRSIILGRLDYYQNQNQLRKNISLPQSKKDELQLILKKCDGLGISGANENSNAVLNYLSHIKKIRVIHAAETLQSLEKSKKITGKKEILRALLLKPHFLVHMTYAKKNELSNVAQKTRGVVICPRANAALAEGIPDVNLMIQSGCNVGIGTDNVMINSPDMFREMDYLWKVTMGRHRKRISPKKILQMATVNAGKILQKKIGSIDVGKLADCIFIDKHALDLDPIHNPHASIVHRVSDSSIHAVMIGGRIVHGKI